MVAQLLGLKLRLLANTFRRRPVQVIGILIGLVYCLGATGVAMAGLSALRQVAPALAGSIAVPLGSVILLGFLLVPLAFGADDPMDPRTFALYGLPVPRLASALALCGLVGVPALVITTVAGAQVVTWARDPLSTVVAVLSGILIVVTNLLGARVSTSIASFLLAGRRAREVTGLFALAAIVSLAPLFALLASVNWDGGGLRVLKSVADVAGWTPLGAAWSAPAESASGNPGAAVLKLLIALAFAGVLWLSWRGLVALMLGRPARLESNTVGAGLGWFGWFPTTSAGSVAARSITYWVRDPRYHAALAAATVAPVLFLIVLSVAGVPIHVLALLPVPVICLFLSWAIHNDVAYDSSALWLHLASHTPGWADRVGRVVPALLIGAPLVLIGSPISAVLYGDSEVTPSLIGVSSSLLLAGLGVSSVFSARFPYPSVRPGDSPFAQPQSTGTGAGIIQSVSLFATVGLSLPAIWLALQGLVRAGDNGWAVASLLVGVGLGLVLLVAGILWGGRIFTRRAPELLAFTLRY